MWTVENSPCYPARWRLVHSHWGPSNDICDFYQDRSAALREAERRNREAPDARS